MHLFSCAMEKVQRRVGVWGSTGNASGSPLVFCPLSPELCGTPGYLAPEILKCSMDETHPGYGKEVDL